MGLCAGKGNFKPALSFAHRLVIYLFEAELVNIEIKGFVLIADANGDGADFREHGSPRLSVDCQEPLIRLPTGSSIPDHAQGNDFYLAQSPAGRQGPSIARFFLYDTKSGWSIGDCVGLQPVRRVPCAGPNVAAHARHD